MAEYDAHGKRTLMRLPVCPFTLCTYWLCLMIFRKIPQITKQVIINMGIVNPYGNKVYANNTKGQNVERNQPRHRQASVSRVTTLNYLRWTFRNGSLKYLWLIIENSRIWNHVFEWWNGVFWFYLTVWCHTWLSTRNHITYHSIAVHMLIINICHWPDYASWYMTMSLILC